MKSEKDRLFVTGYLACEKVWEVEDLVFIQEDNQRKHSYLSKSHKWEDIKVLNFSHGSETKLKQIGKAGV